MAEEGDRNLWDVLGSPKNSDLSSAPGTEQASCINGAQEHVMDNVHPLDPQGTSLPLKATYSSDIPEEPRRNGCDWIEVNERHFCDTLAMEMSASPPFDPSQTRRNICNGTPNSTVTNGTTLSKEETSLNDEDEERTLKIAVYAQSNADRTHTSSDQQDRSIFERINRNFRPLVVCSKDDRSNVVSNGESRANHRSVSPSPACLSPTAKQQNSETCGNQETDSNLFERVKVSASTVNTNKQMQISGESGFPFSEKLRRLTGWRDDKGNKAPNTVQPLPTAIEVCNPVGGVQHIAPFNPSTQTPNALTASFVNGQNSSPKVQRNKQCVGSEVDANVVRFDPDASLGYVNPTASYISVRVRNGIPQRPSGPLNAFSVSERGRTRGTASTFVMSDTVANSNITRLQPSAQFIRLKRVVIDPRGNLKDRADEEGAQDRLNSARLAGPFIAPNPVSCNAYVKTVSPSDAVRSSGMVTTRLVPRVQPASASLQGHSSNSSFQMVFPSVSPVAIAQSLTVNPVVVQCSSVVPVSANSLRGGIPSDLSCGERLLPSPELKERRFRPVSPATPVVHSPNKNSVALATGDVVVAERPSIRRLRSFLSSKCTSDWKTSVETDMEDQSYECALCESANSPDMERFLRCDSPSSVESSQMVRQGDFACDKDYEEMINVDSVPVALYEDEIAAVSKAATDSPKDEIVEEPLSERDKAFKRKPSAAMVRRLEARLPSPVRESCTVGDLYRDPSELTREERALQRAMVQFSVMEMKEKTDATKRKEHSMKRRLRKRAGLQANGNRTHPGSKTWLKRIKRKRLWFSQRRRIKLKPPAQDNNFAVTNTHVQQTQVVRRKRKLRGSTDTKDGQTQTKRKCVETGRQDIIVQPTDVKRKKTAPPIQISTDVKPTKARRNSSEPSSQRQAKNEDVADSTSGKAVKEMRSDKRPLGGDVDGVSMEMKTVKRARLEMEALGIEQKGESPSTPQATVKPDRSRRVKTYMLVTSYQGFRDFKPVVLQSRTRGKAKPAVVEPQGKPKASEFPLLVVESVHSKPCKERVIAESEEVQQMVENCLKAHGKWHGDDARTEGEANDQDALQEAKKLNVNRNTGETVLHKAARLGYHETVRHHIHHGIDPNAKDNAGWTPLHEACSRGKVDVVKVLAKYGSDVNACSNDGIRPIHDAAEGGHVGVLRVLLSYGADPLLATYSGNTALKCAKETQTRAFLEGYLEDLGISNCSSSSEGEGCWEFAGSCPLLDETSEQTSGIFDGIPEGDSVCDGEFEMCDKPHIPTYNLPVMVNNDTTSGRRNYVLLSDLLDQLRMSRALLLKKCRRLDIREMPWSKFLAEIADRPLAAVPKFSPPDSSTQEGIAELVPLNYSVRRLLNIRVECVSLR